MSSHHIVREKQEPALLIAGLDSFDDELLGQLLEWSPTVVVTDYTAEKVAAYGIKIDWLVADKMAEVPQTDIKLLAADGADPANAAIEHLVAHNYPAVNVIVNQLDITSCNQFFNRIDLTIFCGGKRVIAVRTGFSKWKPHGERIEFLTVPHNFLYTGLQIISGNVYETLVDGFFSLQFDDDFVWLAEWV